MDNADANWNFKDDDQREAFSEKVTKENCGQKLRLVQAIASISRRELAKILGVSEATIRRVEAASSVPTDAFMYRLHALCIIGMSKFKNMSEAEREKISEIVGTSGGVVTGIGGAVGAVGAAGVTGFSAAGITSGIAAIGGGTMLGGIVVIAAIPVVTGLAGYGLVKGIKAICKANKLQSEEVDGRWEIRKCDDDNGSQLQIT